MRKTFQIVHVGLHALPLLVALACLVAGMAYVLLLPVETGQGRDGRTPARAYVIRAETEGEGVQIEYLWLMTHRPRDTIILQSLVFEGDRVYDVIQLEPSEGEAYDLYFDITAFYGTG